MPAIYEPKGRAREYSPLALNYFKGCDHGCKYCYVPNIFVRFNSGYKHENVLSGIDFTSIEKSAKKFAQSNQQILLSFTSDPYNTVENGETTKVLEILNHYGLKVAILTKNPEKAKRDLDLIKSFGSRIKVGSTLTFDNDIDSLKWESNAPVPESRINGLKFFSENKVKTWASFEPVIIPAHSLNLLRKVSGFIDHVKIGKINNYKGIDKQINWDLFIQESVEICRELNINFYIKNDLRKFNKSTFLHPHEKNEDYLNL